MFAAFFCPAVWCRSKFLVALQHLPAKLYALQKAHENGRRNISAALAGTEELGHLEMVGTIVYQLTRSMTPEQIKQSGYDTYFVDHTAGVFPQFASGTPWTAATIGVTGDVIADLSEDMSAEQKARKTYDNILRLCDDPDVTDVIRFLREREIVHYQRFGEALRLATEKMDQKNVYMTNPAFDRS